MRDRDLVFPSRGISDYILRVCNRHLVVREGHGFRPAVLTLILPIIHKGEGGF